MHQGRIRATLVALALAMGTAGCGGAPEGTRDFTAQVATRAAAPAGGAPGDAAGPGGEPLHAEARLAEVAAALAALPADRAATRHASVERFVRTYFAGTCHADDRLAFDEVCEHADPTPTDDPSPWPDLMIGLRDGGIASAVLLRAGATPPAWSCMRVPGLDAAKACFPPTTSAEDRARWMGQWTAFFSVAD